MGPLIAADIMLLVFSLYVGIFFRNFHSKYPDMRIGFHTWEVCYSEDTWYYGNKFAGNLAIILGLIFFAGLYPFLIYREINRNYLAILIILLALVYFGLLFAITKIRIRKKFNIKDD